MANDIDIILNATDKASDAINGVDKSLGNMEKASKNTGLSMTELTSAFSLAERGLGYLQSAFDQTVGATVDYANEVRQLMQVTGAGAEETSKLIQVLDDYKVSTDAAVNAQKTLTKEGIVLTTNSLADLSKQYLAITDQAEKNAFAQKMLGRDYKAFIEVLQQGPDAIRAMSDGVDESLVLNQKAIDQARLYEKQIDDLGDAWMGFKVKAGQNALPFVTTALGNFTEEMNKSSLAAAAFNFGFDDIIKIFVDASRPVEENTELLQDNSIALDSVTVSASELEEQERALQAAIKETSAANKDYLGLVRDVAKEQDSYQQKQEEFAAKRVELESIVANATGEAKDKAISDLQNLTLAEQAAANEFELSGRKRILSMLEQKLAIDGLDDAETNYLLSLGQQWGIYSATAVREARRAMDEVNKLSESILRLPNGKTIKINLETNASGATYQTAYQAYAPGYASGTGGSWLTVPPGHNNDTYPINLSSGEQFNVVKKGDTPSGMGGGPVDLSPSSIADLARAFGSVVAQMG